MPEGDTLARIAHVLGELLVGRRVLAAGGRSAARLGLLAGRDIEGVTARGKHLLISFSDGLTLHTHLGLHGSWRHYQPGEAARRVRARAAVFLETTSAVCACFNAPTVELLETRALRIHPALARLGPDVASPEFVPAEAVRQLRDAAQAQRPLGEALLDQHLVAGLGNVYRSELCFISRLHPETPLGAVSDEALLALLEGAAQLVAQAASSGWRVTTGRAAAGHRLYVYGRTGRPCRRCGTLIASRVSGQGSRRIYWCPTCQPARSAVPSGSTADSAPAEEGQ